MEEPLTAKERKMKEYLEAELLRGELSREFRYRRFFGLLPSEPRCAQCLAPFEGFGGTLVRMFFNKQQSVLNPLICNECEETIKKLRYGVELEMSILFADIRGSTKIAENMNPTSFRHLIDRFYSVSTHILMHSYAMIDKLIGDEVSGFYIPSIAGKNYAHRAVKAGEQILIETGHQSLQGPWAPIGVGIHTGVAYFGAVGSKNGMVDITGLGDAVNLASRLASAAGAGEILVSEVTTEKAGLDTSVYEKRTLDLKGKSEPMNVFVMKMAATN